MGMNCGCPAGAHLADLENVGCKSSMGQIQKVIIHRTYKAAGELNSIASTGTTSIQKKASLTSLFAAKDSTKIVITPFIENPESTPGEARTYGGGNQTLGGIEIIIGANPTEFSAVLNEVPQSVIATLKQYMCEDVSIYYIDEYGNIGCKKLDDNKVCGFPVQGFFVGDLKFGGFEEPDSNTISWRHAANWSDDLVVLKQGDFDYNPLTDLANAVSA